MAHHAATHTKCVRVFGQHASEIFDQILLLGFDNQKTIRNQSAKDQSFLLAPGADRLRKFVLQLIERQRSKLIELGKDPFD